MMNMQSANVALIVAREVGNLYIIYIYYRAGAREVGILIYFIYNTEPGRGPKPHFYIIYIYFIYFRGIYYYIFIIFFIYIYYISLSWG